MAEKMAVKFCRHCGRIIPLTAADCPYCGENTIKGVEQKECPFCRELIKPKAIKCKHCGEFLVAGPDAGPPGQQVIHIEKAIIAAGTQEGGPELYRPDGTRLRPQSEVRAVLPDGSEQVRALPSADSDEPTALERRQATYPTAIGEEPQAATEQEPPFPPPEARYECYSCRRFVFENDNFCENCGRDLSLAPGESSIPIRPRPYRPAYFALVMAAASPLGLLLPFPLSGTLALAGAILGGWCLGRILASGSMLTGAKSALGAIAIGLLWTILIYF